MVSRFSGVEGERFCSIFLRDSFFIFIFLFFPFVNVTTKTCSSEWVGLSRPCVPRYIVVFIDGISILELTVQNDASVFDLFHELCSGAHRIPYPTEYLTRGEIITKGIIIFWFLDKSVGQHNIAIPSCWNLRRAATARSSDYVVIIRNEKEAQQYEER
jgi:hypothetical protein